MALAGSARRSVNVIMLGRMGFMPAFDLQSRYARQHLDEMAGKPNARGEDTILLVEHSPVYTVGVRNKDYTQDDVELLKRTGAEFYTTNRGGLITFHGPGQLVAYPILNLTRFKPSMKWYVSQLEKTLLDTLRQFGLKGRLTDQTGVWVQDRKIASIGLHGSRYVTTHGIGLNCDADLKWFRYIVPCGLKGVEMTSLTKELDRNVSVAEAAKPFLSSFQEVFDCDLEYRMLEKEDLQALHNSAAPATPQESSEAKVTPPEKPATANDTNTPIVNNSDVGNVSKIDQRMEIGVRMMSTLTSAPSSVHAPSSYTSSTMSSSSSATSPSSSQTGLGEDERNSNADNNNNDNRNNNFINKGMFMTPVRKTGPMW